MFHCISEIPSELGDDTVSPEDFKRDMIEIKKAGYNPIFFKEYTDAMLGNAKLPSKPIFITFDDGYYSNYRYAYPILRELNMKATISVIGWSVGRSVNKDGSTPIYPHFSWSEAREMYESGLIDIQSHSFDLHNDGIGVEKFPGESEADYRKRLKDDLLKSKHTIESNVGNYVTVFAYPYGAYNPVAESVLKEIGFKYTLTVDNGISQFSDGTYSIKRINVPHRMSSEDLMKTIKEYK